MTTKAELYEQHAKESLEVLTEPTRSSTGDAARRGDEAKAIMQKPRRVGGFAFGERSQTFAKLISRAWRQSILRSG